MFIEAQCLLLMYPINQHTWKSFFLNLYIVQVCATLPESHEINYGPMRHAVHGTTDS